MTRAAPPPHQLHRSQAHPGLTSEECTQAAGGCSVLQLHGSRVLLPASCMWGTARPLQERGASDTLKPTHEQTSPLNPPRAGEGKLQVPGNASQFPAADWRWCPAEQRGQTSSLRVTLYLGCEQLHRSQTARKSMTPSHFFSGTPLKNIFLGQSSLLVCEEQYSGDVLLWLHLFCPPSLGVWRESVASHVNSRFHLLNTSLAFSFHLHTARLILHLTF